MTRFGVVICEQSLYIGHSICGVENLSVIDKLRKVPQPTWVKPLTLLLQRHMTAPWLLFFSVNFFKGDKFCDKKRGQPLMEKNFYKS